MKGSTAISLIFSADVVWTSTRISDLKMQKDFYVDNYYKGTIDYCELSDYIDKNDNRMEELEKDIKENEELAFKFISDMIEVNDDE